MNIDLLKNILLAVVLLLIQAMVLNRIHLFNCATPLIYVYMVLLMPRNYPRWGVLLQSFLIGICADIFSNTPGVAAGSMTFLGFIQTWLLAPFIHRDNPDEADLRPTMKEMGLNRYLFYAFLCVFIYCTLFFTLETFSFFNWVQWLASIFGSTLITLLLILVIENLRGA